MTSVTSWRKQRRSTAVKKENLFFVILLLFRLQNSPKKRDAAHFAPAAGNGRLAARPGLPKGIAFYLKVACFYGGFATFKFGGDAV